MPDVALRALPDVPKNVDKGMWDLLNSIKHNLQVLAGTKGTISNKAVAFRDLTGASGLPTYVSVVDIDDPGPEFSSLGGAQGVLLIAYKERVSQNDEYTVYACDASGTPGNTPFVVAGSDCKWVAIAGKYINSDLRLGQLTTLSLLYSDNLKTVSSLGQATDGQIPIGDTDGAPVLSVITPGDGVDITNAAGSITIDADLKANGGIVIENTELALDLGASDITGYLAVIDGGTGAESLTDGGILLGSGTGPVTVTAQPTDGQLLIGSTGLDPVLSSLTGTANQITITGGAGSITLSLPQDIATVSRPTFADITLTDLTASVLTMTDANKKLVSLSKQAHIADAVAVSSVSAASGADSIDRAAFNIALGTLVTEINAIKDKINSVLSTLETATILETV